MHEGWGFDLLTLCLERLMKCKCTFSPKSLTISFPKYPAIDPAQGGWIYY
jgi:hypothetical protein